MPAFPLDHPACEEGSALSSGPTRAPAGQRFTPLEMLARLVAFDTESDKSNLPLIDFVEDYLAGWGVASRARSECGGTRPRSSPRSARRIAAGRTLRPYRRGAGDGPSLDRDPFILQVEDGRAYGRGAVDMKGFVALALALVPDFPPPT